MPIITEQITSKTFDGHKDKIIEMFINHYKEQSKFYPFYIRPKYDNTYMTKFDIKKYIQKFSNLRNNRVDLIKEGETIVGITLYTMDQINKVVTFELLYIEPDSRLKGTTGITLEGYFSTFKNRKFKVIELPVLIHDRTNYKLFKKYGFDSHTHVMCKKL